MTGEPDSQKDIYRIETTSTVPSKSSATVTAKISTKTQPINPNRVARVVVAVLVVIGIVAIWWWWVSVALAGLAVVVVLLGGWAKYRSDDGADGYWPSVLAVLAEIGGDTPRHGVFGGDDIEAGVERDSC